MPGCAKLHSLMPSVPQPDQTRCQSSLSTSRCKLARSRDALKPDCRDDGVRPRQRGTLAFAVARPQRSGSSGISGWKAALNDPRRRCIVVARRSWVILIHVPIPYRNVGDFGAVHRIDCRELLECSPSRIDPGVKFSRLGLDSAMSVQLIVALEHRFGFELSPDVVVDYPTVEKLAGHLAALQAPAAQCPTKRHEASCVHSRRARKLGSILPRRYGLFFSFRAGRHREDIDLFGSLFLRCGACRRTGCPRSRRGDRALLIFQPGTEFVIALFGCFFAGVIAVPMMPPRRLGARDASAGILADCSPRFALTAAPPQSVATCLVGRRRRARMAARRRRQPARVPDTSPIARPVGAELAFLQYTSGSTAAPKGVMVTHANLLENLEMTQRAFGNTRRLELCELGAAPSRHGPDSQLPRARSMSGQSACSWRRHRFSSVRSAGCARSTTIRRKLAGGPNFAYDLCVSRFRPDQMAGIDLSGWRVAFNGAEPVPPRPCGASPRPSRLTDLISPPFTPVTAWRRQRSSSRRAGAAAVSFCTACLTAPALRPHRRHPQTMAKSVPWWGADGPCRRGHCHCRTGKQPPAGAADHRGDLGARSECRAKLLE